MATSDDSLPGSSDPQQPLLAAAISGGNPALTVALSNVGRLAYFLPTGTVLVFELFAPFATYGGICSPVNQYVTVALAVLCGLAGFVLSFSDSFTDGTGVLRYGFPTLNGLAVIGGPPLPAETAYAYRLRWLDAVHGFTSMMIFVAVALLDRNVVNCLVPTPTVQVAGILSVLPMSIALVSSVLFVVFPNNRRGIGFAVNI